MGVTACQSPFVTALIRNQCESANQITGQRARGFRRPRIANAPAALRLVCSLHAKPVRGAINDRASGLWPRLPGSCLWRSTATPITMPLILEAAAAELRKLGRTPDAEDA